MMGEKTLEIVVYSLGIAFYCLMSLHYLNVRWYRFWSTKTTRTRSSGVKINSTSVSTHATKSTQRPPFNAEFMLYLLLQRTERDAVIGDLVEDYNKVRRRFGKRRADIWFYKQVGGSLFPLLRRAALRIGAFVWLGRVLRRFIS